MSGTGVQSTDFCQDPEVHRLGLRTEVKQLLQAENAEMVMYSMLAVRL